MRVLCFSDLNQQTRQAGCVWDSNDLIRHSSGPRIFVCMVWERRLCHHTLVWEKQPAYLPILCTPGHRPPYSYWRIPEIALHAWQEAIRAIQVHCAWI